MPIDRKLVAERMARIIIQGIHKGLIRTGAAGPLVEQIREKYADALPDGRFGPEITVPLGQAEARNKFSRNTASVIAEATALAGDIRRAVHISNALSTLQSLVNATLEIEADVRMVLSMAGFQGTERPLPTALEAIKTSISPLPDYDHSRVKNAQILHTQIAMLAEAAAYNAATLHEASELLLMAMRAYVRAAHPNLTGNDAHFPLSRDKAGLYIFIQPTDPATMAHLLRCTLKFGNAPYFGTFEMAEHMAAWLVENKV